MLEIIDVNYASLPEITSEELYTLRKETFKDRLDWAVTCTNGMEFDEYDNVNTHYLLGICDHQLVCSVRFIETHLPNMITHTFHTFFADATLPAGNYVESSRFFVDKARAKTLLGAQFPVSTVLFLAMVNYARQQGYDGIYTICSKPMWTILKRSGWEIQVVQVGTSEKDKPVYLLFLPVDERNQCILAERVQAWSRDEHSTLNHWPMALKIMTEQA
ncbi:acyl-homoserine-lactone synthase [Pantoea sp. 1.19]|uniref:acyl-homoserine-lactone synthase n=1 Tax=Pantoea sp. 1.19 TaxID=1925589 RepID=UPI0009491A25|nr:acyl-homoserine-lactone synthase [Pantoea sp. 1.19]